MSDPRYLRLSLICAALGIAAITMVCAGCASSSLGKGLNVTIGVSAAADLITTQQGEARGGREANPLMQHDGWRWLVKSAGVGAQIGLASLADRHLDHGWGHVIRVIAIAANLGVAIHNAGVYR